MIAASIKMQSIQDLSFVTKIGPFSIGDPHFSLVGKETGVVQRKGFSSKSIAVRIILEGLGFDMSSKLVAMAVFPNTAL